MFQKWHVMRRYFYINNISCVINVYSNINHFYFSKTNYSVQIIFIVKLVLYRTFVTLYPNFVGHDTGSGQAGKKYRPLFLDHFDKKEAEVKVPLKY